MGCGWTAPVDFRRIQAIEAINGGMASGPLSGIPFWEARLYAGHRITAVGGSDNHDAGLDAARAPAVGRPTTVVYAEGLSHDAILEGLRAGRVFIDVQGTRDRLLDVRLGPQRTLSIHVKNAVGGQVMLAGPGAPAGYAAPPLGAEATLTVDLPAGARGWVRVDVRGPDGTLWLLGNPVYLD